jgi:hypothetical protein
MNDSKHTGLSSRTVYAYSLALRFTLIALSGPVTAIIGFPILAIQTGEGQLYHNVDILHLAIRMALHVSLAMLAMVGVSIIWIDFRARRKRIDWERLAQRSQDMDRQTLWRPKEIWRAVEECRRKTV